MAEFIFGILQSIGFHHPIHPALTHIPMGMVMGSFLFTLAAFFLKQPVLYKTAYHSAILGAIGTPFTALLGYLDWQYMYGGAWSFAIKTKMLLALILFLLLLVVIKFGKEGETKPVLMLILNGLCMLTAIGLGFLGGELVFNS